MVRYITVIILPTIKNKIYSREPNKAPGLKYEKSGEQLAEEKWFAQVKQSLTQSLKLRTLTYVRRRCPTIGERKRSLRNKGYPGYSKKPLELLDDELFEAKVINPDTKTFNQVSDLPVGYRKPGDDRKYPVRQVLQIYRIKRADGTEWLKSRGRLIGLDKAGNEVEHSFVDPEMFYKPLARHELKKKEPQNESSPLERVCVEAGLNPHNYQYTEYTPPFNQENFDKL